MKIFFVFLAFACLASSLASTSLDFPFDEEDGSLDNLMKKLENTDDVKIEDNDIIITFPPIKTTIYPPRPRPTTTTPETTNTTPPATTTGRPRPTRPIPTTPRPTDKPNKNPQIFKNIFDKQDPFASRLYNFVQNLRGNQAVKQSNDIVYNIKFAKALKRLLEEEE